jgi:hypothetical protein
MNGSYLEPNKVVEYIRDSIELLNEPMGRILFLFTVIVVCISIFTFPKKHIKSFFISVPLLFLGITIAFYHITNAPVDEPIMYIEGIIEMMPLSIRYFIIYMIFYWISVGIAYICSQQVALSTTIKCVLCIVNSIILWIFAKFWFSLAIFNSIFVYKLITRIVE